VLRPVSSLVELTTNFSSHALSSDRSGSSAYTIRHSRGTKLTSGNIGRLLCLERTSVLEITDEGKYLADLLSRVFGELGLFGGVDRHPGGAGRFRDAVQDLYTADSW
jgi:hypothetical protein